MAVGVNHTPRLNTKAKVNVLRTPAFAKHYHLGFLKAYKQLFLHSLVLGVAISDEPVDVIISKLEA